jgi:SSS family solute:Na+ symporter
VVGFTPLAVLAVSRAGGWQGMAERLPAVMTHSWKYMGSASQNPMGIETFGMVFGLGFVLSFGYWCTNFLVVQRAMAADSIAGARLTPIVGAFPKMFLPFIVIIPGIAAVALSKMGVYSLPIRNGAPDYTQIITTLMASFYPSGLLGVGLTGLMASFMSGMAGNVTAFNTVFTYDIYQSYIKPNAPDHHYLTVGRITTVVGVLLSIGAAYMATAFDNIMDFLQLVFGFVNAPLLATFLLGMFWKRSTGHGAFAGMLAGTAAAAATHGLTVAEGKGGWIATVHQFPSSMAQNFWIATLAFAACFLVTMAVSMTSAPRPEKDLEGLVYGLTKLPHDPEIPWYRRPVPISVMVAIVVIALNLWFA